MQAISQAKAEAMMPWYAWSRLARKPTGSAHSNVQATVRHGTNQRPSDPACAAATTRKGSTSSAGIRDWRSDHAVTRATPHTATDRDPATERRPEATAMGASIYAPTSRIDNTVGTAQGKMTTMAAIRRVLARRGAADRNRPRTRSPSRPA